MLTPSRVKHQHANACFRLYSNEFTAALSLIATSLSQWDADFNHRSALNRRFDALKCELGIRNRPFHLITSNVAKKYGQVIAIVWPNQLSPQKYI